MPAAMATYRKPELAQRHERPHGQDGPPRRSRSADQEDRGEDDQAEPDGGEEQRRHVVHAPVDDHEVEAPDGGHEGGEERVACVHDSSLTGMTMKHQRMFMAESM